MNSEIGEAAGKVYQFLESGRDKSCSYSAARKGARLDGKIFDMAVGWLAREDKITLARSGRTVKLGIR